MRQAVRRSAIVQQTSFFCCFLDPGIIITVAIEDDTLVFPNRCLEQVVKRDVEIFAGLHLVCINFQAFCNSTVQHNVGARNTVRGTNHTELKFIACKGKGGGAVPIGRVPAEFG